MKNGTLVVIAHGLSTIQHADIIVVINEGSIVETGTYTDHMNKHYGYYRKLHSYQAI